MTVVLHLPQDLRLPTSHTPGVRFASRLEVTRDLRRAIVLRFERERSQFRSVKAFAEHESVRLRTLGAEYSATAIAKLIGVHRRLGRPPKPLRVVQLIDVLRRPNPRTHGRWFDLGDLCRAMGVRRADTMYTWLGRLRQHDRGVTLKRRVASQRDVDQRGWRYEYRIWESATS